jgi:plastocyanin
MTNRNQKCGISRISLISIIAVVIVIAAVSALYVSSSSLNSSSSSCTSTTTFATGSTSPLQISIISDAYSQSNAPGYNPDNITVVLGVNSTVVWKNNDSVHHTVTTSLAPSGASFDSGNILRGGCYTHAFTALGTYKYYCSYHPWMVGEIRVVNSSSS